MSQSITANIKLSVGAALTEPLDIGTASHTLDFIKSYSLANGAGANQAQQMFTDRRTLAASASENLDLAGVLENAFGTPLEFDKIKALVVCAAKENTNDVVVGGHATAACAAFFGDVTDTVKVKPGGMVAFVAPNADGYAVTAGTADMLTVTNGGAGTGVTYDIIVIGTAA